MDVDDNEVHSLNRKSARVRGNGSQLSSDNSIIHRTRKSSRNRDRTRRKSPSEIDLNANQVRIDSGRMRRLIQHPKQSLNSWGLLIRGGYSLPELDFFYQVRGGGG